MTPKSTLESAIRIFAVAFVFYWCILIFRPFGTIAVWSMVIAIALYPFFQRLTGIFKGKKMIVAILLNVLFFSLILIPLLKLGSSLGTQAKVYKNYITEESLDIPAPDPEIKEWPLIGDRAFEVWTNIYSDLESMVQENSEKITNAITWLLNGLIGISVDLLLTIGAFIISTVLMLNADSGYAFAMKFFQRIAGDEAGAQYCNDARDTIRNVVKGVVLVALIQATLAGLGFAMIGLPLPGLWAVIVFMLAVMQLPASIVTLPLAAYVFSYAETGPAVAFLIYAIFVGFVDNILKPIFLGKGMEIPMLVILIGSLGGMLMMGILGLFIGPVIFSLGYRLLLSWMNSGHAAQQ